MTERVTRHGEIHMVVSPDTDNTFEKRGGYQAPRTPFELPEVPAGPAQGAAPASSSDTQSQTTTPASND